MNKYYSGLESQLSQKRIIKDARPGHELQLYHQLFWEVAQVLNRASGINPDHVLKADSKALVGVIQPWLTGENVSDNNIFIWESCC